MEYLFEYLRLTFKKSLMEGKLELSKYRYLMRVI